MYILYCRQTCHRFWPTTCCIFILPKATKCCIITTLYIQKDLLKNLTKEGKKKIEWGYTGNQNFSFKSSNKYHIHVKYSRSKMIFIFCTEVHRDSRGWQWWYTSPGRCKKLYGSPTRLPGWWRCPERYSKPYAIVRKRCRCKTTIQTRLEMEQNFSWRGISDQSKLGLLEKKTSWKGFHKSYSRRFLQTLHYRRNDWSSCGSNKLVCKTVFGQRKGQPQTTFKSTWMETNR